MDDTSVYALIKNLDDRTQRIEQYLPTLPTREETHAAIQAEGEASRQFTRVLFEDLRDDNRIMLECLVTLSARADELAHR